MADRPDENDLEMSAEELYREEVFTDQRIGTIRRMIPVTAEGRDDPSREVQYLGQTQILTPAGALPLSFEIEADSLEQATRRFGHGAAAAAEETIKRLEEMRRDAASSIVLPGQDGGPVPDPRSMPGGGKLKL